MCNSSLCLIKFFITKVGDALVAYYLLVRPKRSVSQKYLFAINVEIIEKREWIWKLKVIC